jgi:hypothetical protein
MHVNKCLFRAPQAFADSRTLPMGQARYSAFAAQRKAFFLGGKRKRQAHSAQAAARGGSGGGGGGGAGGALAYFLQWLGCAGARVSKQTAKVRSTASVACAVEHKRCNEVCSGGSGTSFIWWARLLRACPKGTLSGYGVYSHRP